MATIFLNCHLFIFTFVMHLIFKSLPLQKVPMLWNKLAVIFYTSREAKELPLSLELDFYRKIWTCGMPSILFPDLKFFLMMKKPTLHYIYFFYYNYWDIMVEKLDVGLCAFISLIITIRRWNVFFSATVLCFFCSVTAVLGRCSVFFV